MTSKLRTASWILLSLLATLTLLGALGSASFGLTQGEDQFGAVSMTELTGGDESIAKLIHGRRLTAAAFTSAYSVLLLFVILFPYRRGEQWSWWAILVATLFCSAIIVLRVPFLGIGLGASIGYFHLGVVVVALLLDVGRLRSSTT
jgi:hypothetical protein